MLKYIFRSKIIPKFSPNVKIHFHNLFGKLNVNRGTGCQIIMKLIDKLVSQELLDCTPEGYGGSPDGCTGNFPLNAWNFVYETQSVPTMRAYPYKNKDLPCRSSQHTSVIADKFKLTNYKQVKSKL